MVRVYDKPYSLNNATKEPIMYDSIEKQAAKMAANAKPGIMQHSGKIYTFVFCHNEWVYKVYEDGFFLLNVNTKSVNKAKAFLKDWLAK